jgi:Flp pilus assembly protein TadD
VGLGRALIAAGKFQDALAYLDKAVRLNPRDEVPCYQLSLAYKALGKPDEQKAALNRFLQLKAANADAPDILGSPTDVTKQEAQ